MFPDLTRTGAIWLMLLLVAPATAVAAHATDQDMQQSALVVEFHDAVGVAQAHEQLDGLWSWLWFGDRVQGAVVVFASGMTAGELAAFAQRHRLDIAGAIAKQPLDEQGMVGTHAVGGRLLHLLEDPLEQRLEIALGNSLLRVSEAFRAGGEEARVAAMLSRVPEFYTAQVVGRVRDLQALPDAPEVAGVRLAPRVASEFEAARTLIAGWRQGMGPPIRRRLEDGPPPGIDPDRIIWGGPIPMPRGQPPYPAPEPTPTP